jgi:hypothetical protein
MKEELQGKLVEILTSIQTAAGKASDFAMAELPDIAQSYVAFGRAYETFWFVATTALLLTILIGTAVVFRLALRPEGVWDHIPPPLVLFIGGMASFISAAMFADSLKPFLMVWLTPKVWLLKEVASLLK